MANKYRSKIVKKLEEKYGKLKSIGEGHSLFLIPSVDIIIYFRYSKISQATKSIEKAFYGLRREDIALMQSKKSFICFLTDDETKDIVIPFQQFESYFLGVEPSKDGQYKTLSFFKKTGTELYFSNVGKFSAESYLGTDILFNFELNKIKMPQLSHSQVQSLIGAVGICKGFDIWFPQSDKAKIDSSIVDFNKVMDKLPNYSSEIDNIISEIDVIWLDKTKLISFYEVEHSTPIYSGLLRFNDVLLTIPKVENFNIVADNDRESKFGREINRPTFKQNKLIDKVTFLDYSNIYNWFFSLKNIKYEPKTLLS